MTQFQIATLIQKNENLSERAKALAFCLALLGPVVTRDQVRVHLGCSPRAVSYCLRELREAGLLQYARGTSYHYGFTLLNPSKEPHEEQLTPL